MSHARILVLLIEDDRTTASIVSRELQQRASDFELALVESAAAATEYLEHSTPDVVLLDIGLPDSQGLDSVVRFVDGYPELPLVVLTASTDEKTALQSIQRGAQDYLMKDNLDYGVLSRSIRYSIERKRTQLDLRDAKESAEAASRAKSEFLAHMSHEIRSPLTAIIGYAENLLEPHLTGGEHFDAVDTIRRNGGHLLEIVNDILDISKIESRKFEVDRIACSPVEMVEEVVRMMRIRAQSKNLSLHVEWRTPLPETIFTDPLRLKQILVNLISNAVKFTTEGQITVVVSLTQPTDRSGQPQLEIAIADTGVGMTHRQQQRVFEPYRQAEPWTNRKFGGTGLGLSISKDLAEKLGGGIDVESNPGQGSTFRLRLATGPLEGVRMYDSPEHAQAVPTPKQPKSPNQLDARVLLAEDGADNQRLISFVLRKAGARVDVVENGTQALEAALQAQEHGAPYDVILMDMIMPQLDGYQATKKLREAGYEKPIVALTANAMSGQREVCLQCGCSDYATKPIDRSSLVNIVRKWLPSQAEKA